MSAVTFRPAPAVARIAEKLIPKYHTDLADADADVRYVFRSEHAKSSGKAVFGRAKKISGLNAYLAQLEEPDETGIEGADGDFFVIEIAEDIWKELSAKQREALVDHELCHCTTTFDKDGNLKLVCAPHDLEEFNAVVERHGLWRPDVVEFEKSIQLSLAVGSKKKGDEPEPTDNFENVDNVLRDGAGVLDEQRAKELAETATVDKGKSKKPPKDATQGSGTDSNPPEAAQTSVDAPEHEPEPSEAANGAEGQTGAVVDGSEPSTDTASNPGGGSDTDPSGPQASDPATPAQRLSLGRHIAGLDESLTNEFLEWCRKHKTPVNPQEMTFEQARRALLYVGEREPAASA